MGKLQRSPFSRVFTIEDRAGPANAPKYQGLARAMSPSQNGGDVSPIWAANPGQYGAFDVIDTTRGAPDLPQLPLQVRYQVDLSEMLRLFRKRCPVDVQVHMGSCKDPRDFNSGWDKILVLEGAVITQWGTNEIGAFEPGDDSPINEEVPFTGLNMYELKQLIPTELAAAQIVQEVVDVAICDSKQCGECGIASNGCLKVFAIQKSHGGSPGLPGELIASVDGGQTIIERNITTLTPAQDASALACVGTRLVIVSQEGGNLHYANTADILLSAETWTASASGLVTPTGSPRGIFSLGARNTWVIGAGGYVYFYTDITSTPVVQTAGTVTSQALNAIHGIDDQNLVAVGASNAVIVTANGGDVWTSVTGPAVGIALNAVWMRSKLEWFVGTNGGRLFYTRNGGRTWVEKSFSGSGAGVVRDIVFSTPTVGYMAHDTATPVGRLFRTIDGGNSWYLVPDSPYTMPDNDKIGALAACAEDPNVVFGGGLAGNATDGFLVKAA